MKERICQDCDVTFVQTNGPAAQRCPDCRVARKRQQERDKYRATTIRTVVSLMTLPCEDCGSGFTQSSGRPARRCPSCRPEAARRNAKRWYAGNPDKVAHHKSRDPEQVRRYRAGRPRCDVPGCDKPKLYRDGFCLTHHSRLERSGTVEDPQPRPAKESLIDGHGYRMVRVGPGKYVGEHRLVVEAAMGRPLESYENVHHKNGRRLDNSLSNLEVWVTSQPSGQRAEDLADWVVEHYPDLVRSRLDGERTSLF